MYDKAMEAIEKNLLFQSKPNQLYYFADLKVECAFFKYYLYFKGTRIDHKMDHLACFIAGMYALQSKHEWNPEKATHSVQIAAQIANTCHESYIRTGKTSIRFHDFLIETGIGPESFRFTDQVEAKALRDIDKYYILRPEAIESWFLLWRVTGNEMYREWCWDFVKALDK